MEAAFLAANIASECAASLFFLTVFSLWLYKPFGRPMVLGKIEGLIILNMAKDKRFT